MRLYCDLALLIEDCRSKEQVVLASSAREVEVGGLLLRRSAEAYILLGHKTLN